MAKVPLSAGNDPVQNPDALKRVILPCESKARPSRISHSIDANAMISRDSWRTLDVITVIPVLSMLVDHPERFILQYCRYS